LRTSGEKRGLAANLQAWAAWFAMRGDPARAARLHGAAAALRDAIHLRLPPARQPAYDRDLHFLRAALGTGRFAAAWAAGSRLSVDQAIEEIAPSL
jgi:hypothetical protein